jgi:hypothetical protein
MRLALQFEHYLDASRFVPEISLVCSDPRCVARLHEDALAQMKSEIVNLRRGGLFASRIRAGADKLSEAHKSALNRRVRRLANMAVRTVGQLPRSSFACTD